MTEWLDFHFSFSWIGEENVNPLQCSCLENPRDGGAWWAPVYGVAQSQTRLKRLSSSSSSSRTLPGVTNKFGLGEQNEAGQRLAEFCQENALVIANTLFQQHKRWLYTWTSPSDQYWNEIDFILFSRRWRSCTQSAKKKRPGADCDSHPQLLTVKFRLKLKKVGKTTRPARYDLNPIPYEYAVEVMNRLKGSDLVNNMPEELWTEA